MQEMKDRIKKIMELQHVTQQEFADKLNIAPATLSSIFTGRTRPTLAIVDAIKTRYPQISTDWLMFGKGNMLESGVSGGDNVGSDSQVEAGCLQVVDDNMQAADNNVQVHESASRDNIQPAVVTEQPVCKSRETVAVEVKKCDTIRQRHISEIRIFYDDQTWETFVPKTNQV